MKKNDWDLFFMYWSTLDAIGHFFWNYYDPSDPSYKEDDILGDVIPNMYILFDEIIGWFLDSIDKDTTIIVMSDHGHGGRPSKLVNINEILREAGYLKARDLRKNPHIGALESKASKYAYLRCPFHNRADCDYSQSCNSNHQAHVQVQLKEHEH